MMKIRLWLQKPPRVQWCLKLVDDSDECTIIIRTWFDDYPPDRPPPPAVVGPYAQEMARLAGALRQSPADRHYAIEVKP